MEIIGSLLGALLIGSWLFLNVWLFVKYLLEDIIFKIKNKKDCKSK
jgi:hypothetical protein